MLFQLSTDLQQTTSATTADDGTYSIAGLAPGIYDVTVFADGYLASIQRGIVVSDQTIVDATLAESQTTLDGTLVDASGNPVPGGSVVVLDGSGHILGTATVNPDGSFTLSTAQGNNLTLEVSAQGYAPATLPIAILAATTTQLNPVVLQPIAIDPGGSNNSGPQGQGSFAPDGQAWADLIAGYVHTAPYPDPPVPPPCPNCIPAYDAAEAAYEVVKQDADTTNLLYLQTECRRRRSTST